MIILLILNYLAFNVNGVSDGNNIDCIMTFDFFTMMNNSSCHTIQCKLNYDECKTLYYRMQYAGYCDDGTHYYNNCSTNNFADVKTCAKTWFTDCIGDLKKYVCNKNEQNCNDTENIKCYNKEIVYYCKSNSPSSNNNNVNNNELSSGPIVLIIVAVIFFCCLIVCLHVCNRHHNVAV